MSRRREHGLSVGWMDAFGVARPPAIGRVVVMGLMLLALFCLWLFAANLVIGTLPLLVGLSVVLPVLGHASWHLYREVVVR